MKKPSIDKLLGCWKPLKVGIAVRISGNYKNGWQGVIVERLDTRIDGLGRYGVKLDSAPSVTTDYVRAELQPL